MTPLPVGSEVKLEICLGDHVIRSSATVVRVQEPSWFHPAGVGVQFKEMEGNCLSALEEALQELPAEGESS